MSFGKERIIALIDCDCFYATVESVRLGLSFEIPLAVNQWNMLIAVNYAARGFGISRMDTAKEALKKCPQLKLVHVETISENQGEEKEVHDKKTEKINLARYREANAKIMEIFTRFASCIERASVDEAYLDITNEVNAKVNTSMDPKPSGVVYGVKNSADYKVELEVTESSDIHNRLFIASNIVDDIRGTIFKELGYSCSAGISINKVFAKIAAGFNKPNNQTVLLPEMIPLLLESFPFRKLRGLGGLLGKQVEETGVKTLLELKDKFNSELKMHSEFGVKNGSFLWDLVHGIDREPVRDRSKTQSLTVSKSFAAISSVKDASFTGMLTLMCEELTSRVDSELKNNNRKPSLFGISWSSSSRLYRSKQFPFSYTSSMYSTVVSYFATTPEAFPLTGLGLSLSKMKETMINSKSDIANFFSKEVATQKSSSCVTVAATPSIKKQKRNPIKDFFQSSTRVSNSIEDDDVILIDDEEECLDDNSIENSKNKNIILEKEISKDDCICINSSLDSSQDVCIIEPIETSAPKISKSTVKRKNGSIDDYFRK